MYIDFQIINFTRPEGGDNTSSISPTDNAVKLFIWKSIVEENIKKMDVKQLKNTVNLFYRVYTIISKDYLRNRIPAGCCNRPCGCRGVLHTPHVVIHLSY